MEKIIVEPINNYEKIFWITEQKISNRHEGRIYPVQVSDITTSKSVAIYIVEDSNKKQIAQLACVDYELLEKKFNNGEYINLNYTYINDFSWYGTNKLYEVDESIFKNIQGISACCSFWNAENNENNLVTLIQLSVMQGDVHFKHSVFYKTALCLTNINIFNGCLNLDYVKFWSSRLDVLGISCNKNNYFNAMVSINYSEFKDSSVEFLLMKDGIDISFLLSKMRNSKVDINNTMNSIGNVCLTKSKLDKFHMSFCQVAEIDARECEANLLYFKGCILNGQCEIDLKEKSEMIFDSCLFNSILKLNSTHTLEKVSFENTINNGRIYFKNFNKFSSAILNNVDKTNDFNQLLMLKENFRNLGEYKNEDLCYSKYRRIENRIYEKGLSKMGNYLASWISDYGTKPQRVFICIITLILAFSLFYYLCPLVSFDNTNSFVDYVYISGITFFTVGYGDILPLNDISKIIVLVEAFLEVATMSYFLVVLSRKIIR